ncbi:MAG: glycosyl hydrolase [Edaphobacter sp.]
MRLLSARFPQAASLIILPLTIGLSTVYAQNSIEIIKSNFKSPPAEARPIVRWWWFGTAVEKPEILHELQQMKADGIGGAELAFVYPQVLNDPAKNLINESFVGPAMLDNVRYAQAEARKLGLRIDITLGSGWPYGGPATTTQNAARRLRTLEYHIPPKETSISTPTLAAGETFVSAVLVNSKPLESLGPSTFPPPGFWDPASAQPLQMTTPTITISPVDVPRVALFFVDGFTGQQVKRAAVGAEGYVLDPFSHEAVATHLQKVGDPLLKAFGPTPPYAIFSDSLEADGADWTPNLPAEFLKRRGYDLLPHLPELVAGGTPAAEKVKHDWGQTLTELVNENYLTQINNWAIARHTKFRSQTYGEPAVSFSSQKLVPLPEGEGPQWRAFSTLRWASSANHVFHNNVTSGETFTWLHSPVFRATPLDMKAEADIDFIMGENQLIFHGWPYSPPDHKVPEPGWSLYAAAVFNDHNPWHPVMPDVTRYIQSISYLLRQGEPANQVAILLPTDDAWASFSPANPVLTSVTGAMQSHITPALMSAILSAGYNVDYIDADAINSVGLGTHQILVIPPTDRIPYDTVNIISLFAANGGKVIVVGHAPSLTSDGKPYNPIIFKSFSSLVADDAHLTEALHNAATPDLQILPLPPPKLAEIISHRIETTPDLATLAVADKELILRSGSPDEASKMFSAIKGKSETVPALVIEASSQILKVAVSDDAQRDKRADFIFIMTPLDPGVLQVWNATAVGHMVWLTGTYASYASNPLIFTMSDGAVLLTKGTPAQSPFPSAKVPGPENCIGFIRRKLPNADIYFVANTGNQPINTAATFATSYKTGEAWNPDTASSLSASPASASLQLAPYESRVFVFFTEANKSNNVIDGSPGLASLIEMQPTDHPLQDLSSDWQVSFTGTKETETEPTLTDWTVNPATLYYSGEAVYARDFNLATQPLPVFLEIEGGKPLPGAPNSPEEHPDLDPNGLPAPRITHPGPGIYAYYDPPIREAAIVFLNGQRAGALWHPPYRLDISKLLKPGQNHIEIRVYNTALNAWSALPPHDNKPLIQKYGDRFQMQDLDKVQPIPSGILGAIYLVTTGFKDFK